MKNLHENESPSVYQCWSHTVTGVLACQVELLETQCQVGFKMVEAALHVPDKSEARPGEPVRAAPQTTDDFQKLEALALERTSKGFAPPTAIYAVPYRNRIDWSRFPDWARPIDPEVFVGCGHEG
jgi:hypothetical protein